MKYFFLMIFLGLFLRLLLVGNTGFLADISFWKSWSMAASDHGIVWTSHNTNINYPPGFFYVLWLMGKMYTLVGNPHDYYTYWKENNFAFLLIAKSFAIVADVAIAGLIYWFFSQREKLKQLGIRTADDTSDVKKVSVEQYRAGGTIGGTPSKQDALAGFLMGVNRDRTRIGVHMPFPMKYLPLLLSSIFFLNPVVIIDSALWGQVESFGILFTLIALILIFYKKPTLATVIFTIGFLMKLQNIIYIPLYFLFILRVFDIKTLVKSIAATVGTFALVTLPFILAKDIHQALFLMIVNNDYFPWISLNANNLWWIVSGGHGMQISDKITVLGIANAKTVGLILFSSWYLLSTLLLWKKPSAKNLFLSLSVGIFSFFLYTAESHERYSYPILVFLLFYFPFLLDKSNIKYKISNLAGGTIGGTPSKQDASAGFLMGVNRDRTRGDKSDGQIEKFDPKGLIHFLLLNKSILFFWIMYAALTIAIFFNIHMGLIYNYPENGFRILTQLTTAPLTIFNSYILILLSFLLLYFVFKEISWAFGIASLGFFLIGLTMVNASYIFSPSVSLTSFKPIIISQGYGGLQVNMSVNSGLGNSWHGWSRLSTDYFFYRKGFGTHAASRLVFDVNKKFSRFTTDFGVDTESGTYASVAFKIYADKKELFTSSKMGRFDFPQHADVDIEGVKYLELIVTDGGDGINDDHADWLNPVLYK